MGSSCAFLYISFTRLNSRLWTSHLFFFQHILRMGIKNRQGISLFYSFLSLSFLLLSFFHLYHFTWLYHQHQFTAIIIIIHFVLQTLNKIMTINVIPGEISTFTIAIAILSGFILFFGYISMFLKEKLFLSEACKFLFCRSYNIS